MDIMPQEPSVAIIDDERAVRTTLARLLRSYGMSAEAFASGSDFLARLHAGSWQIVILDARIAGISGFDVLKRIRDERPKLAVIMITGEEDPEIKRRAYEAGAQGFLFKPFAFSEFLTAVRTLPGDVTAKLP